MKPIDAKIKTRCVKSYLKGESTGKLSELFGVTRQTIRNWHKKYGKYGTCETIPAFDGRGRPPKISAIEMKKFLKILGHPASNYGFETDLWNTKRMRIICERKFGVNISAAGMWYFLQNFKQSFKNVRRRYYEVNSEDQNEWKRNVIPKIIRTVKKYRAILYFEDESAIQFSPVMRKSWGPVEVTGKRGSIPAISAISNSGRILFNLFDKGKRFDSDDIIQFLRQILKEHPTTKRHLVIVMDNAPCHKSKKTLDFIESQKNLHVFFLPPRSPKFNPDEQVGGYLKHHGLKSPKNLKKAILTNQALQHLHTPQII